MKLRLIPVVEFEPWDLGVEDFGELLDAGEWAGHWSGVLARLGLCPIQPGHGSSLSRSFARRRRSRRSCAFT